MPHSKEMKKLLVVFTLLFSTSAFAQEGVSVEGNKVTAREVAPVWPGCKGTEAEKKQCFQEKLVQHIKENYKFPRESEGNYIRGKSIVAFEINEKGKVELLKVKGASKALNDEAQRIILAIPPMKPGELAGKPIAVKYAVPFTF